MENSLFHLLSVPFSSHICPDVSSIITLYIIFCDNLRYYIVLRRIIILCFLLAGVLCTRAQYDPSFSHYFDMESSFNPAAVGKQAKLNVTAAYALDMAGFEHNPRTMYLAADMPFLLFNHQQGVGAHGGSVGSQALTRSAMAPAWRRRVSRACPVCKAQVNLCRSPSG